jgi:hypothetical protein
MRELTNKESGNDDEGKTPSEPMGKPNHGAQVRARNKDERTKSKEKNQDQAEAATKSKQD